MSRPTSDDAMHSIAILRPLDALHPEDVLGPDYLQHLVETAGQTSGSEVDPDFGARSHDSGPRRTRVMAGVLAVVVVIAAVSTFLWTRSSPTTTHAIQLSPWRTVAATFPIPFERQTATSPQMSHDMTCPTVSTCYLLANGKGDVAGYKTSDGGETWENLVISGADLTTPFACPNALTCFAGGFLTGGTGIHAVVLATSDGGASWETKPFAFAPQIDSISCPSATTCVAGASGLNYGPKTVPQVDVYWSVDAGGSWRAATSLPSGLVVSLDCPTVTTCIGLTYVQPAHTPTIESLRTTDGGYSWQSATLGVHGVAFRAPSCPDASHCVAIVQTTPTPDPSVPGTLVALASADGGQSWQPHDLPANISTDALQAGLSCPTDLQCWAAILLHQDQGSPQPAIASTTDGGQSWQQDPINDSCTPSGCLTNIQALQCPASSTCLALGDLPNFHLPLVLLTNRPTTGS
jgi:hypothetical protein